MKQVMTCLLFFALLFPAAALAQQEGEEKKTVESEELVEDASSEQLLAVNASQYGMKYRETQILLQNRMGLRIEYTLDRYDLQLWISPQANKSMSYVDRNWSNRDDHTDVFDRILIPGCDLTQFERCDWDPFHSIIYFKDQTMHIAQIYDQPAALVWFEKEALVDFKIYGDPVERSDKAFIINHTDRGRDFQSAAVLGHGDGYFQQQLQLDQYRSVYTRAHLQPGQVLLITSELREEQIGVLAKEWVQTPVEEILARNEEMIAEDLQNGQFRMKNRPEMQKLLDKSRRVALSMQDFGGFMRSTNQYIYYLMWYRDGGMNTGHLTYTGWVQPTYDHVKFALNNPNFTNQEPEEIFFGQVMGGPLTKWQEDGLFYVVWPAFNYWTQTGDKSLCTGEYLETMDRAMDWLEKRAWDEEAGLFGRYFACETPMTGSRDDGWDNVTGAPTYKWGSEYEGETIVRSYDNYVNLIHYSTYLMLSAMHGDNEQGREYYEKAMRLEKNMKQFFEYDGALPSYGELLTEDGEFVTAKPYGMDIWDYVWGLALPPFKPTWPAAYKAMADQVMEDMTTTKGGYFLCVYFAMLTSMDTQWHDEQEIMDAMDMLVDYSSKPGKYLPMPYAVPEMFNISDDNPFHDVRPLVYSIAPWLSAITNLGLRRLPFGIAARGTEYLESLENYVYKNALLDVSFSGKGGEIGEVLLNGEPLAGTLQIPEELLLDGDNTLEIVLADESDMQNCLVSSTVQLHDVEPAGEGNEYKVTARGKNVLTFRGLDGEVTITDETGNEVDFEVEVLDGLTWIEFNGRGVFTIRI